MADELCHQPAVGVHHFHHHMQIKLWRQDSSIISSTMQMISLKYFLSIQRSICSHTHLILDVNKAGTLSSKVNFIKLLWISLSLVKGQSGYFICYFKGWHGATTCSSNEVRTTPIACFWKINVCLVNWQSYICNLLIVCAEGWFLYAMLEMTQRYNLSGGCISHDLDMSLRFLLPKIHQNFSERFYFTKCLVKENQTFFVDGLNTNVTNLDVAQ